MPRSKRFRPLSIVLAAVFVLGLLTSACSGAGDGAPSAPGQYSVQKVSVHFDGDRYQLYWADNNGSLHHLDTQKLRLVRDPDRTFLEVSQGGDPVLHLREDQEDLLNGSKLRSIIRKYSDHIVQPIRMTKEEWKDGKQEKLTDEETVNQASALWARAKGDIMAVFDR